MERKVYSDEEVKKRIAALPQAAADMLYSPTMSDVVRQIGDKYQLHIDQLAVLDAEAGELILGFTDPNDFVPYVIETLNVEKQKAEAIAKDVNDLLMVKIRESMKNPAPKTSSLNEVTRAEIQAPQIAAAPSDAKPAATITPSVSVSATQAPVPTTLAAVIGPTTQVIPKPAVPVPLSPDLHAAEVMMQKTIVQVAPPPSSETSQSTAPAPEVQKNPDPTVPASYKADPYREPVE